MPREEIRNNHKNRASYAKAAAPKKENALGACRLPGHDHLWKNYPQNPYTDSKKRKNKQHSNHHDSRTNEVGDTDVKASETEMEAKIYPKILIRG